jgi:predicted MFS family arabinose efflux permease
MRGELKNLLLIIIVPTIAWVTTAYLLYNYWRMIIQKVSELSRSDMVFPFWVTLLILLIGYIASMLIIYALVKKEEIEMMLQAKGELFQKHSNKK